MEAGIIYDVTPRRLSVLRRAGVCVQFEDGTFHTHPWCSSDPSPHMISAQTWKPLKAENGGKFHECHEPALGVLEKRPWMFVSKEELHLIMSGRPDVALAPYTTGSPPPDPTHFHHMFCKRFVGGGTSYFIDVLERPNKDGNPVRANGEVKECCIDGFRARDGPPPPALPQSRPTKRRADPTDRGHEARYEGEAPVGRTRRTPDVAGPTHKAVRFPSSLPFLVPFWTFVCLFVFTSGLCAAWFTCARQFAQNLEGWCKRLARPRRVLALQRRPDVNSSKVITQRPLQ